MKRRIRVTSETFDHSNADEEFMDLPDDWDDRTKDDKRAFLDSIALNALLLRAGSGAEVVDEHGNEVED